VFFMESVAEPGANTVEAARSGLAMDSVHRELVTRIREMVRRKHWSANQLADFSGVGRGYLSDILSGKKSPTVRTLVKIAEALEVDVRDLFGAGPRTR
jgi:DNA-binding phage protein